LLQSLLPADWVEQGQNVVEDTADGAPDYAPEETEQIKELLQQSN